jgi:hypothetical protein
LLKKFNIQSPTRPGVVHIKVDAQVILRLLEGNKIKFPMDLVPCTNSSGINGNHQNNWTSRIYLGVATPFLAFVPCIVSSPLGLHLGGIYTSLDPL